jgi:hypothetical protein
MRYVSYELGCGLTYCVTIFKKGKMMTTTRYLILSILILTLLVGCTPAEMRTSSPDTPTDPSITDPDPTATSKSPSSADPTPTITFPTNIPTIIVTQEPETGLTMEDNAVMLSKEALADELGISTDQIEVEFITKIDWPDASLGCPQKGMSYAQMIVPGFKIILKVGDDLYNVHVGEGRAVICQGGQPFGKQSTSIDIPTAAQMGKLAQQDLADQLAVPEDEVKVNWIKPQTWPDASLGCPEAGTDYAQVETEGFEIELESKGETYTYHSDMEQVVPCDK